MAVDAPASTTTSWDRCHALIGGLVGAGLAAGGVDAISWPSVTKTLLAIVASPLVAFGIAFLAMFLVAAVRNVFHLPDNAKPFKWLQLVSAGAVSFGHGANDAQKTMGVIAALLVGTGHLAAGADGNIAVPTWVEFAAYGSIALGTVWGGWKIIETMGLKITTLHAASGVAANIGAVTSIFGATGLGVPISTTHAAASSVAGAGVGSGMGINLKVVGEMVLAWIITLPTTIVLAFGIFKVTQLPGALAWIVVGLLIAVVGSLIVYAMLHSVKAEDIEAELLDENVLALPVTAHPQLEGHGPAA
jgi:PiT family inorganic phosphate transporter